MPHLPQAHPCQCQQALRCRVLLVAAAGESGVRAGGGVEAVGCKSLEHKLAALRRLGPSCAVEIGGLAAGG